MPIANDGARSHWHVCQCSLIRWPPSRSATAMSALPRNSGAGAGLNEFLSVLGPFAVANAPANSAGRKRFHLAPWRPLVFSRGVWARPRPCCAPSPYGAPCSPVPAAGAVVAPPVRRGAARPSRPAQKFAINLLILGPGFPRVGCWACAARRQAAGGRKPRSPFRARGRRRGA